MESKRPIFDLGETDVCRRVLAELDAAGVAELLARHQAGDWGDLDAEGRDYNEWALEDGGMILSAYLTRAGVVWVITETDKPDTIVSFRDDLLEKERDMETRRYALIMGRSGSERSNAMLTINVEGERVLPLFESAEKAEEYSMVGGLGDEWQVVDDPDGDLPSLLRLVAANGVGQVVLDPPVALRGGEAPSVSPIRIERFLED